MPQAAALLQPIPVGAGYPETTRILYNYALQQLKNGTPFYVSPNFNSDVLRLPKNMGLFVIDDILAAAVTVASTVAAVAGPAAKMAAVVNEAQGVANKAKGAGSGVSADSIAAAILPNVQAQLAAKGVQLPNGIAHQTVSASILDSFGPQYHNLVLFAGLGLGALLLLKTLRG